MWEQVTDFLARDILGITVGQLLGAFVAVLAGFIAKQVLAFMLGKVGAMAQKSKTRLDDIMVDSLSKPVGWGAVLGGVYVATLILPIPKEPLDIVTFIDALARAASITLLIWFAIRLSDRLCNYWAEKAAATDSKVDDQAIPIIKKTMNVFFVLVGGSLILQNLGYSVGSLIAGLGLGGMALALASKDTLANLFGAIVIFWDRPFAVGDWVEIGDVEGTVEEVGLRTTRVRTFANSQITLPNMKLTTASINNWSRMKKRRIKMNVGVTYDTPPVKVRAAVQAIQDIIKTTAELHQDFYLVRFDKFGPSSLDIFIYCFTVTTVWADFLEVKEQFLLNIMERFQEQGIEFAFPTQTLHVASMPGGEDSGRK